MAATSKVQEIVLSVQKWIVVISLIMILSIFSNAAFSVIINENFIEIDPKDGQFSFWSQMNSFFLIFIFPFMVILFIALSFFSIHKKRLFEMIITLTLYLYFYFRDPFGIINWLLD